MMKHDFNKDGYLILNEGEWLKDHLSNLKRDIGCLAIANDLEDPFNGTGMSLPNGEKRGVLS